MRDVRDMEEFAKSQSVIEQIYSERRRQIDSEGWSIEHDDEHDAGDLARAAAAYALLGAGDLPGYEGEWPVAWGPLPTPKEARRALVVASALIVAEIERLDRAALAKGTPNA